MRRLKHAIWAICAFVATSVQTRADLRFDGTSVNLGEIRAGVPLRNQFTFVNDSPGTVELIEARPGCGCLVPQLDHRQFAPGQRGAISLDVHSLGQAAGPHTWLLTVAYRDGEQLREKMLAVTATVVIEVSVQPASLTLFADGPVAHELTLTDLRAQPLTITRVETTAPWLYAKAQPLTPDAYGHHTAKLKLEIGADCPTGRHAEFVVIYTSDPQYRELKVAVTVVKRDRQGGP